MSQRGVAITLLCLAAAAVGTDVSRLTAPQGERYVNYMRVWPSDFRAGLEGTRALVAGLDPYRQALPGAVASDHFVVDGVDYRYLYPPTHLLLYLPLALLVHNDLTAAYVWFWVVVAMLLALAAIAWRLADAMTPTPPMAVALAFVLIALQPGTVLALERVQSDVAVAFLCWLAVALVAHERRAAGAFVAVAAALVKPYPALFALGVVAAGIDRAHWKRTALAVAAALALLFAPVARWWPESVRAIGPRAALFWPSWQNWSLTDVAYAIHPSFADAGRVILCALCAGAALASWLELRRALAAGDAAARALWLTLFALCALEAVIGWAKTTYNYAMVLVEPALLVAALAQPYLHERLALSPRARAAAAVWLTLLVGAFWLVRPWWRTTTLPLAGFAIFALAVSAGAVAIVVRRRT